MESNTISDIVPDIVLTLFVINVVQLIRQEFYQSNKS